jgi:RimJ/RimL family protein N-acetyltransferase
MSNAQRSELLELSLTPWSDSDFQLLRRCNAPELTVFVGGPESEEQLIKRHRRYLDGWKTGTASIFRISLPNAPQGAGTVGYWNITWQGKGVFEAGWTVTTEWQGKGIASLATKFMMTQVRQRNERRFVHAFPTVENLASNRVCEKVGFVFNEECNFDARNGGTIKCNDWIYDLGGE